MGDVNCNQALEQLYTFLDGELDNRRRADIAGHLDRCRDCADVHHFEAELKRVISSSRLDEVPHDLRARVLARLRDEAADGSDVAAD